MKKLILLAALFITSFAANAQLADGSTAPDFTATDINGVEWNLYEILDQGKTVILDISATWCPPCWSYHESGVLEQVWEEHGPDGADDMFIFFIEGDASTTMADLQGATGATMGDWITGTPYPIIDNAQIANDYAIAYYPTMYIICPDKIVTEIGQVGADAHIAHKDGCPAWISGVNNVAAGSYTGTSSIACGEDATITPSVNVINLGEANLTSATVELLVDGSSQEVINWTGDLATTEAEEVTFADITVNSSAELSFVMSNPNGTVDDSESNNIITTTIGSQRAELEVTFTITTDFWPEEITWQFKDDTGATLFSNEDEGALTCDNTYTQVYNLDPGKCYTLSIQDSYGDGILNGPMNPAAHSCSTPNGIESIAYGAINLSSNAGVMFDAIDYGNGTDIEFITFDPNAVEELTLEELNLFPNPASGNVTLSFGVEETTDLEINLYNMFGQQVKSVSSQTFNAGSHTLDINTTNIANGMYFVNISDGNAVVTRKLTIAK